MLDLARFAFSRSCIAGTTEPARPPGCAALPHRATVSGRRFPPEATARLVAIAEAACLRELKLHLEDGRAIVGLQTEIHHVGIAVHGVKLFVHGRAQACGENEMAFDVVIDDPHDRVATAHVVAYVAETETASIY